MNSNAIEVFELSHRAQVIMISSRQNELIPITNLYKVDLELVFSELYLQEIFNTLCI